MNKTSIALGLALFGVTLSAAAHAQMTRQRSIAMGVDVGAAITESQGLDSVTGPTFLARAGYEFGTGLTPEVAFSYSRWSRSAFGFDVTESQVSVLPGFRWSILGGAFRPWISLHIGYGALSINMMGQSASVDGIGLNTGAGLDWMFLPKVGVGLHATWNKVIVSDNGGMQQGEAWVDTGAGIALLW